MVENEKALKKEDYNCNNSIQQNKIKESFVLYTEQKEIIENLSDADAGKLIKGIFQYVSGENPQFDSLLKLAFIPIRQQLDRNAQKYADIKEKRSIAGAKGAKQKMANLANANFAKRDLANQAVNVNVNDNVNVNVNNNEKIKIPTKEEIEKYCKERNNNIDIEQFYLYYSDRDWKNKDGKLVNWKLCVITWEKNDKKYNQSKGGNDIDSYNPYL